MTGSLPPLPLRTKLAFGVGAVGEMVYLGMFNTFITIFYNQALGLPNWMIGTAVLLALVGDAISDPTIGVLSDRWRSRLGRRHPFLLAAPLPLALSLWFIFNPPEAFLERQGDIFEMGPWPLFFWLAFWTIFSRLCVTLYTIPHLALGGEIARSPHERSQVFSLNSIMGYATGALFTFLAWSLFLNGKSQNAQGVEVANHLLAASYVPLSLFAAATILFAVSLCAFGTLQRGRLLSEPLDTGEPLSLLLLIRKILSTLKNRNYLFLLLGFFFFMISSGIFETLNVFVQTYVWELAAEQIRWLGLAAVPGILAGASLAPLFMRRFDRKPVLLGAIIGLTVFSQLVLDLRLLQWFPENGSPWLLPLLITNMFFFSYALGTAAVAILSMIGDVIDQNELFTGEREEGLFYSARAFFAKLSSSVGHFVAGIALDVFVRLPHDAVPGELAPEVVTRLAITAGPVMGIAVIISIFFYAQYNLPRDAHAEITRKIEERRVSAPDAGLQNR